MTRLTELLGGSRWLLWAILVTAFLAPRIAYLDADPPVELSGSEYRGRDFWLEPPAKAHEARNWALFGTWHTNPADRYQFWRHQSPVWVYPLAATFSTFGVSYATLRSYSLTFALAGFLVVLTLARRRYTGVAWFVVGICLAWSYYSILFDRSALIEVMLSMWVAAMFYCLLRAARDPVWLIGSQLFFALAFFAKQGAVYIFPVFVAFNVLYFRRALRSGEFSAARCWTPVVTALLVAATATILMLAPEYQRAIEWNYGHMMFDDGQDPVENKFVALVRRVVWIRRYRLHWFVPFPIVGTVAMAAAARIVLLGVRSRRWNDWDVLVVSWFVASWLALLVIRQDEPRFTLVLVSPMFLLFGQFVAETLSWFRRSGRPAIGGFLVAGSVSTLLLCEMLLYVEWVRDRGYELVQGAATIRRTIANPDAVVVGRFSAPLVLETNFVQYYVKWHFNTEPEVIRQLGITHALLRTYDEETTIHIGKLGDQAKDYRVLTRLSFRGDPVDLVEFEAPLH